MRRTRDGELHITRLRASGRAQREDANDRIELDTAIRAKSLVFVKRSKVRVLVEERTRSCDLALHLAAARLGSQLVTTTHPCVCR
jgi:hypothetical protein